MNEKKVFEGVGNNKKGLFVANAGQETHETKELLTKMLQAAGFAIVEDALVFWMGSPDRFNFSMLRNEAGFSKALFFGIAPNQAGLMLTAKHFEPLTLNGVTYLFSNSLADIQANPALKRPLWEGMKSMFLPISLHPSIQQT